MQISFDIPKLYLNQNPAAMLRDVSSA